MDKKTFKEEHQISTEQIGKRIVELLPMPEEDYVVTMIACRELIKLHGTQNVTDIDALIVKISDNMFNQFKDFTAKFSSMLNDDKED